MPVRAGAAEVREAEDLTRELFGVEDGFDVVLFQAEAIASLEAAVRALAVAGKPAASVMTSFYGGDMDAWFASGGATTVAIDLQSQDRAVTIEEVERLLDATPELKALALVQGEALTGLVNPIDEIAQAATRRGVPLMIDSVSSVGAEPFTPWRWGRTISVIGMQKALGGPTGVSVVVVERSLWADIEANPSAPRRSFLSLLDLKHKWLDRGRTEWPGMPNAEDVVALITALQAAQSQGIAAIEAKHQNAKRIARAAVGTIDGLTLAISDAEASGIATTFRLTNPALDGAAMIADLNATGVTTIKPAGDARTLRWVHYDDYANRDELERVGTALAEVASRTATGPRDPVEITR
jgi:aspartate aminotransferase-like enzyme